MKIPASILAECPMCQCETLHEVLSGKVSGGKSETVLDSTARCKECHQIHKVTLKAEKPVEVPVIISWLDKSKRSFVSLGPDEAVEVGDEIMCVEEPVLVTSIESKGARVKRVKAREADTIWAKRFDKVRVPFSISHQGKSFSEHLLAVPDEEFFVGDMLKVGRNEVVIHAIKIADKSLRAGGARARDIVRVYANIVRRTST